MPRVWVNQQFGDLPLQMEGERLWILTRKLRGHIATVEEKEELIKGHLRLMISVLGTLLSNRPKHMIEDLLGEAALALTEAVNDAEYRLTDDNITKWIVSNIIYKVKDAMSKPTSMVMPVRTLRFKLAKGINKSASLALSEEESKGIPQLNLEELKKIPEDLQHQLIEQAKTMPPVSFKETIKNIIYDVLELPAQKILEREFTQTDSQDQTFSINQSGLDQYAIAKQDVPSPEFLEAIWKSAETPMQKAIMALRMEGHTYAEIGKRVGFSTVRVGEIVNDMAERFDYLWR